MKTSTILTSTSLVCLLSSLALVGCGGAEVEPVAQSQTAAVGQPGAAPAADAKPAPEAMRPEAADHHRGPRGKGRGNGPPNPEKLMDRFDANKNGTLEAAELPERMQKHIGDIDKSGDGVVSKDELAAHFKARFAEKSKERFARKDTNKDGLLDESEVGGRWAKLSVADQNGDKKLTPEELRAAFESGKLEGPKHRMRPEGADKDAH